MASTTADIDLPGESAGSGASNNTSYATQPQTASSSSSAAAAAAAEPVASGSSGKSRLEAVLGAASAADGAGGASGSTSNTTNDPEASTAGSSSSSSSTGGGGDSTYECTICLETAKDAVVSMCGHLFCWPCLHQWLETRPQRQMCPVCKAAISKDKVIPLYGRDNKNQQDPRTKAPPRPTAQRTEPETSTFHGFGFPDGGGFHMSFGIGAFPFGFFTSSFNFGSEGRPVNATEEEQFLSKLFLWVGILFLAWLILA